MRRERGKDKRERGMEMPRENQRKFGDSERQSC